MGRLNINTKWEIRTDGDFDELASWTFSGMETLEKLYSTVK
jgi:hypothetical protein